MNNYMKTIISGLKQWVSSQKSDWNQNDSSAVNFIKNRPFYSEEKEKVLFSGNIPVENFGDNVYGAENLAYGLSFVAGQIYKITFDNVEYLCECKLFNSDRVFGNTMIMGIGEETEEPFFIGYNDDWGLCLYCLAEGTHFLSILGTVEEVHQIDKKFVPMPDLADVAHTGSYYDLMDTPYIPWDTVQYATSQSLPDSNKQIARNNIGASSATNLLNGTGLYSLKNKKDAVASAEGSLALGCETTASGKYSHAVGYNTTSSGNYSHAEGSSTLASGNYSHAEGDITDATGQASHAEGYRTLAYGGYSHAEGCDGAAFGTCSHVEGQGTRYPLNISGSANATEFTTTTANTSSYLGGKFLYNNQIYTIINTSGSKVTLNKALSSSSITNKTVFVYFLYATEYGSHAEGTNTNASSANQHVQGKYNIEDSTSKYAHIVGNGTSNTSRSNAHTLDWDGNAWFAGNIYVGGTGQDDAAAVEVALKSDLASLSVPTAISLTRIDEICNQTIYSTNEVTF